MSAAWPSSWRVEGIRVPRRQRQSGAAFGGVALTRGQLYAILKNAIYTGMIVHKGTVYPGKHLPIIDQEQWDAVQRLLAAHVQGQRSRRIANQSLLVGKIVDGAGGAVDRHPREQASGEQGRGGQAALPLLRQQSRALRRGSKWPAHPAREIEGLVTGRIAALFRDPPALIERAKLEVLPAHLPEVIQRGADPLVQVVRNRPTAWRCDIRGLENEILRSEAAAATWP